MGGYARTQSPTHQRVKESKEDPYYKRGRGPQREGKAT